MGDAGNRYNLDEVAKSFLKVLDLKAPVGVFFRDSTGVRWKFVGQLGNRYIASHGEYGVVMTVDQKPDGSRVVTTDLKKLVGEFWDTHGEQ